MARCLTVLIVVIAAAAAGGCGDTPSPPSASPGASRQVTLNIKACESTKSLTEFARENDLPVSGPDLMARRLADTYEASIRESIRAGCATALAGKPRK